MNRTLLLILCDFLLLNLLALTRWEQAEPTRPEQRPSVRVGGDGEQTTPQEDVADVMRLSLEDERAAREALEQRLGETQAQLQERAQTAEQLEARSTELASTLSETRETAEELRQRVEQAARDAATSRERMEQLQRDLEQREAEAARQQQQLAELEKQRVEAQQRIQQLDVAVRVAEQEKSILRETADTYRE